MIVPLCALLLAAPQPAKAEDGPRVIVVAKQAAKPAGRALAWSLLPDPLDLTPGNSAQMWIRAGLAARSANYKWSPREYAWAGPGPRGTDLDRLPLKDVKQLLDKHQTALDCARRAALMSRCDWDCPPVTIQTLGDTTLGDVQMVRELVNLLSLRCRTHLAQDNFEEALADLRIGLTLARDVGQTQILIHDLVGLALASIMFGRVEEWVQRPGSPNLYWALTELPRPLIDVRKSFKHELGTLYRSFPSLRELKAKKLSAEQAKGIAERVFVSMNRSAEGHGTDWKVKLGLPVFAMKYYPTAKKELVARGRSEKEVEALPVVQAVALFMLEEYDRVRDEFVRCTLLPPWQGYAEMEKVERAELPRARENGNVLIAALMPAMVKVYGAQMRVDRDIAGLRAAEAIRLFIGKHGRVPATLGEVTEVPLPTDPFTGKGLDAWYSVKNDKAVLDVPPTPGMPARLGKRYEFPLQAR